MSSIEFKPAPDLPTAMGDFTAAIQNDNISSALMHALQILEFVGPLCRSLSAHREFAKTCAEGFDHDTDAHRYGTYCRVCEAEKILYKSGENTT